MLFAFAFPGAPRPRVSTIVCWALPAAPPTLDTRSVLGHTGEELRARSTAHAIYSCSLYTRATGPGTPPALRRRAPCPWRAAGTAHASTHTGTLSAFHARLVCCSHSIDPVRPLVWFYAPQHTQGRTSPHFCVARTLRMSGIALASTDTLHCHHRPRPCARLALIRHTTDLPEPFIKVKRSAGAKLNARHRP